MYIKRIYILTLLCTQNVYKTLYMYILDIKLKVRELRVTHKL